MSTFMPGNDKASKSMKKMMVQNKNEALNYARP
jgi:hypothetical protein